MRGVSLEQIVATTKISRRLLQALEDEQFELLPGGIFNRSYVRAYAKCVGINEDEAVAEYLEAAQEAPPDTRVIAHQHSFHSDQPPERSGFPLVPVLIFLVVAAGGAGGWKMYQDHQREMELRAAHAAPAQTAGSPGETPPVSASGASNAPPAAKAQSENREASAPAASSSGTAAAPAKPAASTRVPLPPGVATPSTGAPFEITVRPKDRAWVSIKADGNYVVRGIIKPPEVRTIHASNEVVFFTGNAGAVEIVFDGKNVPVTGGPNDEQTLVFNPHGLLPRETGQ